MAESDHRQISRDSLFLLAELRVQGHETIYKVKVRNLSAGGMMAEGDLRPVRGALVSINIRNIGWIEGSIAWVQGSRCGIAFVEDIDPIVARAPVGTGASTPRFTKPPLAFGEGKERLRKI